MSSNSLTAASYSCEQIQSQDENQHKMKNLKVSKGKEDTRTPAQNDAFDPRFQGFLACKNFGKPTSFTIETSTILPLWLRTSCGNELQFLQCHLNLLRIVGAIMRSNLKQMQPK